MVIFLDTSALYALAVPADLHHKRAVSRFNNALQEDASLVLHNLIIVETVALLQRRESYDAARRFVREARRFKTIFIDEFLHREALEKFTRSGRRQVSLVDRFSFEVMRREGIEHAFAFDADFKKQGFVIYGED